MARRRAGAPIALTLLILSASIPRAAALSMEGRWRLVEQRYGQGKANLADPERPLRLEIVRNGISLEATIRSGNDQSTALSWPAFSTDAGPAPIELLERSLDIADTVVRARYRVHPSNDDPLTLDIVEEYRVEEDGRALVGTYAVSFLGEDSSGRPANHGSYVLVRRFEREP